MKQRIPGRAWSGSAAPKKARSPNMNRCHGLDVAHALAVSPGGRIVFVTGASCGAGTGLDFVTIAYDAITGTQLWLSRYNGPGNRTDSARSVAVSPDGRRSTSPAQGHHRPGLAARPTCRPRKDPIPEP
jgi:hypothetical protein